MLSSNSFDKTGNKFQVDSQILINHTAIALIFYICSMVYMSHEIRKTKKTNLANEDHRTEYLIHEIFFNL